MTESNAQFFNGRLPSCSYSDEDFTDEKNTKLLFARGFLICKNSDVGITPHFLPRYLGGGFYLYTHSLCRVEYGNCNGTNVIILGLAVFATRSSKNENIAQTLAEIFANDGEEKFLDTLDCLGGSYVVILQSEEKMYIYPDAATLRSIFYAPNKKVIASHVNLANVVVKGEKSSFYKYLKETNQEVLTYYVDDSTDIDGIFRLIPNFSLRFDDFSTQRFYPRKQRKILDFESKLGGGGQLFQVKQELFEVFHTQLENLKSLGENIVFGLTGGHDSGVSFHATRKLNSDCFFFTHTRDEDIENASQIAKYYKLNWTSLEGSSIKSNPYYQVFKQSVMSDYVLMTKYHGVIGFLLLNMFPGQWIHIHSVVHEAARGRKWEKARSSLYSLEKFILRMRFANHQKLLRQDPIIVEMAENYFAKLNHAEVARLGYNPWDFSYIETNDGGFLSRYCDDFDPVFESISFANCRRALEIMWQVPDEYINQSSLLYKCIMNEHDFRYREKNMGKDFKPSPKDYDNYALVYGGYLLKGDPIEIAKRALEINPTIEWAKKALQNPNPEKK